MLMIMLVSGRVCCGWIDPGDVDRKRSCEKRCVTCTGSSHNLTNCASGDVSIEMMSPHKRANRVRGCKFPSHFA